MVGFANPQSVDIMMSHGGFAMVLTLLLVLCQYWRVESDAHTHANVTLNT